MAITKSGRILSWESHLIHQATAGDPTAFELLADLYRPLLLGMASRMLRNPDDANDAVQETLIKAFRALKDFDPERPLKPWLSRICANCCVDAVRNRRHSGDSLSDHEYMLQDDSDAADTTAEGAIRNSQVMDAISRLPEQYRKIIFMRHFRHMEVNEIATELHKPEGTVKSWLFRARAMLKKDLRPVMG